MSEYCDVGLEDRLRSTYRAVTSATAYGPPPPIAGAPRKRRAPKRFLLFAGALLLVLAIVGAVAALSGIGDSTRIRRPLRPVEQQSLFPDVVPHQGPELLLAPQQVPDG